MLCSSPVLTATSAELLVGAGGECIRIRRIEDANFGHADPGLLRMRAHRGHEPLFGFVGAARSMTFTPIDILAIHFEMSSEMNAPPKPKTAEMTEQGLVVHDLRCVS